MKMTHGVEGYRDEAVLRMFSRINARSAVDKVGAG